MSATVTLSTPELRRALSIVKGASAPKAHLEVLHGVLIEATPSTVTFTCTDLEAVASATVSASCDSPGASAVVDVKALWDSVPTGNGVTTLTFDGSGLSADHGRGLATCPTVYPTAEWPQRLPFADDDADDVVAIPTAMLADVAVAQCRDKVRPILTAVCFDGLDMAATDSYRLHVATRDAGPELHGLMPLAVVNLALKAAKAHKASAVGVAFAGRNVTVTVADVVIGGLQQEGEFPPWRSLVPKDLPTVIDLSGAVDVCKAVAKVDKDGPVRFSVNGELTASGGRGAVTASLPLGATTPGTVLEVGFNPRYLADALAGTDGQLALVDHLKPALARTPFGFHLLMPVRIS